MPNKADEKLKESILGSDLAEFTRCLKYVNSDPENSCFKIGILHFLFDTIISDKSRNEGKNRPIYDKMMDLYLEKVKKEQDPKLLKKILELTNEKQFTLLLRAINCSDFAMTKKLIDLGANVNAVDQYGQMPILVAAGNKDPRFLRVLLETKKTSPNFFNAKDGASAGFYAVTNKFEENFKILLEHGFDIMKHCKPGSDVLSLIVQLNADNFLKILIDGNKISSLTSDQYFKLLFTAISLGNLNVLKELLRLNINITSENLFKLLLNAAESINHTSESLQLLMTRVQVRTNEEGVTLLHIDGNKIYSLTSDQYKKLLFMAINSGNLNVLKELLRVDIDITTEKFSNLLQLAAESVNHSSESFQLLIARGVKISADREGHTPLYYATDQNRSAVCDAEYDYVDDEGNTPLHRAIKCSDMAALKKLLEMNLIRKKYLLNAKDKQGRTLLFAAVSRGSDFVKALLDFAQLHNLDLGLDVTASPLPNHHPGAITPITLAVSINDPESVKHLLAAGVNRKFLPVYRVSLLHFAAEVNAHRTIPLLLDKETINEPTDTAGNSILDLAVHMGATETLKELLSSEDLDITHVNSEGHTALHRAFYQGRFECFGLILCELEKRGKPVDLQAMGIDINQPIDKENNHTILDWAVYRGDKNLVAQLLKSPQLDIVHADIEQITPIHRAILSHQFDILLLLLDALQKKHGTINIIGMFGNSLLHYAAHAGDAKIFEELLRRGLVPIQNANGDTPLHAAAFAKQKSIFELFLHKESLRQYVSMTNAEGNTAYSLLEETDKELKALFKPAEPATTSENADISSAKTSEASSPSSTPASTPSSTPSVVKKNRKKKPQKDRLQDPSVENNNNAPTSPVISPDNNNNNNAAAGNCAGQFPPNFAANQTTWTVKPFYNPIGRKTTDKWWGLLEKYKKVYEHRGDELVRIPFGSSATSSSHDSGWGIPKTIEYHEHMDILLKVFRGLLNRRGPGEVKLNDGIYIVGSTALNALLLDRERIEYNDTDILLVGADLKSIKKELEKNPNISCHENKSAFGSSLTVNFYRDGVKEPVKSIDITSVTSDEFLEKLNSRDVTVSAIALDITNLDNDKLPESERGEVVGPWPCISDFLKRQVRALGTTPKESFTDDYARKYRAIRVKEKLKKHGFKFDPETAKAIKDPDISFEQCLKRGFELLKAANPNITERELRDFEESKVRGLQKQIVKLISSCGLERTLHLLKKNNLIAQSNLGEGRAKKLIGNIGLPKVFKPELFADSVLFDQYLAPVLDSLRDTKLSLREWANENKQKIIEIAENLEKGKNVFKLNACRFLTALMIAGVDVELILKEEKTLQAVSEMKIK